MRNIEARGTILPWWSSASRRMNIILPRSDFFFYFFDSLALCNEQTRVVFIAVHRMNVSVLFHPTALLPLMHQPSNIKMSVVPCNVVVLY